MKLFTVLLLTLLVASCSESSPPEQEQNKLADSAPSTPLANDSIDSPQREFPILTNKNYNTVLTEYWANNPERKLRIVTNKGNIDIALSEETPIHSSTFLMLSKRDYFDDTYFTRVVPDFIIQGGSSDQEEIELKRMLIGGFNPMPEFRKNLIHQRGAVSMARHYKNNPKKRSTPYSFFIVVGRTFNEPAILGIERDHNKDFTPEEKRIYRRIGGAPHLDGEHTVFGRVTAGMDVVDAISKVKTDGQEWPIEDILIKDVVLLD